MLIGPGIGDPHRIRNRERLDGGGCRSSTGTANVASQLGLIDVEKETARLAKELDTLIKEVARAEKKLSNQNFVAKAPADVIEKERAKQKEYMDKQQAVKERLAYLESLV